MRSPISTASRRRSNGTATPTAIWRYGRSTARSWNSLQFTSALADGDALYDLPGREEVPRFRANMSESEVMEFVVDSLAAAGAQKIEASGLAPAPFGPRPGFRFDLAYQSGSGLDKLGMAIGTLKDGELYLIIFTGAAQHYYPKYKPAVDALFASIQI